MSSCGSSADASEKYSFTNKVKFDAKQDLWQNRSQSYAPKVVRKPFNVFAYPPENFIAQTFAPRPPKRNSRDAIKPETYTSFYMDGVGDGETVFREVPHPCAPKSGHSKRRELEQLARVHQSEPDFRTRFRSMRAYTAKRLFVSEGSHPREPFSMPKPFDHRGLPPIKPLGITEFDTTYEKDPFALKAHSRNLRSIRGNLMTQSELREVSGPSLAPPLRQPEKWESRLHLPQDPFPVRSAAYTRYRQRNRNPYVAFMDTVEERLTKKWKDGESVTKLIHKYGPIENMA